MQCFLVRDEVIYVVAVVGVVVVVGAVSESRRSMSKVVIAVGGGLSTHQEAAVSTILTLLGLAQMSEKLIHLLPEVVEKLIDRAVFEDKDKSAAIGCEMLEDLDDRTQKVHQGDWAKDRGMLYKRPPMTMHTHVPAAECTTAMPDVIEIPRKPSMMGSKACTKS
jgi:hypothetical protein